jgi:hypothetical protein
MQNKYPIGGYAPAREIIEDILFKTGKHNQEECSEIADIILKDLPKQQGAVWVKASERVPINGNLYHLNYKTKDTNFKTTGYYSDGKWYHQNHELIGWAPNLEWLDESP